MLRACWARGLRRRGRVRSTTEEGRVMMMMMMSW